MWENGGRCVSRLYLCRTSVPKNKSLPTNSEPLTPSPSCPAPANGEGSLRIDLSAQGWQGGATDVWCRFDPWIGWIKTYPTMARIHEITCAPGQKPREMTEAIIITQ